VKSAIFLKHRINVDWLPSLEQNNNIVFKYAYINDLTTECESVALTKS